MLSRVAERIYWMARYVERAENTARLININTLVLLDLPRGVPLGWQALIDMTGASASFAEFYNESIERNVVRFLAVDERNPGSLMSSLKAARENARTIRDVMPRAAWERVNELYLKAAADLPSSLARSKRHDALISVIDASQQLTGILEGAMLHDAGYEFLRLGRHLERADMITRIIDVRTADALPVEAVGLRPLRSLPWMSLLRSLSGYQAYRQQVQAAVRRQDVLEFLFKSAQFPRAINHCAIQVNASIGRLPRNAKAQKLAESLIKKLEHSRVRRFDDPALHRFVDLLQMRLGQLHEAIGQIWFEFQPEPATRSKRMSNQGNQARAGSR